MGNLFNEQMGFRLQRLEIYNWGTFDKEIWTMTPNGHTAVLTGANGSGKSTVVDALLTLLIESRQRNYNLASGANSGRERSERTYVRGQYSRSRGDSTLEVKANTLRDNQSHSILLAVFYDASQNRFVTLAQILWISNVDRVEKRFYVASCDLCIEKHFPQRHLTQRDFPPAIQKQIHVFSSFSDYITEARKALGLSGKSKALSLFNQTVSVKDIPSLNTFIREHMLDKGNPEERVEALRAQYRELNEAYNAIQRATKQMQILTPLVKASEDYYRYQTQSEQYELAKTMVPFYVASKAKDLLNNAIRDATYQLESENSKKAILDSELEDLRDEQEGIKLSIRNDNVVQEKREVQSKIENLRQRIQMLQRMADKYDRYARILDLVPYRTHDDFYQNRASAEQRQQQFSGEIQILQEKHDNIVLEIRDLAEKGKALQDEIVYLRANPSNIPQSVARIRQMMCEALNIPTDRLMFVGELLKVRSQDAQWEGVLERLLNGFAQDLIVPDALYHQISQFVDEQHLRGRLVYHRVSSNISRQPITERTHLAQREMAYQKLEIAPNTPYHDWLADNLMHKFAYVCCDTLADFQQAERAITRQGQIKHSRTRHEKDDRHALNDRTKYVLGWDNRQKLRQLERELSEISELGVSLNNQLISVDAEIQRLQHEIRSVDNLLEIASFEEIDWRTPQTTYDRLQQRLTELNQQSKHLHQLEARLSALQDQIAEKQAQLNRLIGDIRLTESRIEGYKGQVRWAEGQLAQATIEHERLWEQIADIITEVDKEKEMMTIENFNRRTYEIEDTIQRTISRFKGFMNQLERDITGCMIRFRSEYPDEGVSLTAELASLDMFLQIYNRLETDDLPRHQERFKQMVDSTVARGIQIFYSYLRDQEREIDRSIAELNDSLANVDYGGGSVIRLIADSTHDPEINDFLRDLKACFMDVGDSSPEERQRTYNQVKALIQRFDNDPNWMHRVIDVRRWRSFSAEQRDSDGRQIDYYSDSSGKSGGQKAKLAYTILASAIAHQYGLQDTTPNNRTFRFVVIDEAFSKLDDENARFAMKLFEQLGLQLLVVTPMQQLHVIESYVKSYHLVVNNTEGSYSRLFNLTEGEYRQKKREFSL